MKMKMVGVTRNKSSPPSSSPSSSSSIIARVFPVSWFTKRKQKVEKPETKKGSENYPLDSLFQNAIARFHSMDEDELFHGSDEKGSFPARRSTGGMTINPVFYESRNFDDMVLDMQRMKGSAKPRKKVGEMKVKAKKKGNTYSPRTECKIRALEETRRARTMMKKRVKEGKIVFKSFAVVRNSYDPHRDFRDSMVEMIMEERIRRPEDLELLLACYLDLNSHEYHDIIINAFKHVCLEFFFSF